MAVLAGSTGPGIDARSMVGLTKGMKTRCPLDADVDVFSALNTPFQQRRLSISWCFDGWMEALTTITGTLRVGRQYSCGKWKVYELTALAENRYLIDRESGAQFPSKGARRLLKGIRRGLFC